MLEVRNIQYKIPGRKSDFQIAGIDFRLEKGYFMAILGENGAGKSTLLRLLFGALPADAGEVLFCGERVTADNAEVRRSIGYLGEEAVFLEHQTVWENQRLLGSLYPEYSEKDFRQTVERFDLGEEILQKRVDALSLGQKKQVQLAFVLARHPRLLLLDEPMGSLDAVFRVNFLEFLQERIAEEEISVVLSTHLPDEIEDVVDYIGILKEGTMERFGSRSELLDGQSSLRGLMASPAAYGKTGKFLLDEG